MVVLRSSVSRAAAPAPSGSSSCSPDELTDSSSEFISLEPSSFGGRRIWTRSEATSAAAGAAESRRTRTTGETEFSSGKIEGSNGPSLRSTRKITSFSSDSSFDQSVEILSENVNQRHSTRQLAKPEYQTNPKENIKKVSSDTPTLKTRADADGSTMKATFTTLLQNIPAFAPVLLLATSDVCHAGLPKEARELFSNDDEVFKIQLPKATERRMFFEDLIINQAAKPPASKPNTNGSVHCRSHQTHSRTEEQRVTGAEKSREAVTWPEICELKQLLDFATVISENINIFHLEKLYGILCQCIYQHREDYDKTKLVKEMKKEITAFGCFQ